MCEGFSRPHQLSHRCLHTHYKWQPGHKHHALRTRALHMLRVLLAACTLNFGSHWAAAVPYAHHAHTHRWSGHGESGAGGPLHAPAPAITLNTIRCARMHGTGKGACDIKRRLELHLPAQSLEPLRASVDRVFGSLASQLSASVGAATPLLSRGHLHTCTCMSDFTLCFLNTHLVLMHLHVHTHTLACTHAQTHAHERHVHSGR